MKQRQSYFTELSGEKVGADYSRVSSPEKRLQEPSFKKSGSMIPKNRDKPVKALGIPGLCHFHRGKEPFSQRRGVKLATAACTAAVQPKRQWQRRREKRRERTLASGLASLILRRTVRPLGVVAAALVSPRFSAPNQHRAMVSRPVCPVRPVFVLCAGFVQAAFPSRKGTELLP